MKECSGCRESKPLEDFYVSERSKQGRSARCRPCHLAHNKLNNEKKRSSKICAFCKSTVSRLWYKGPKCEACYKVEARTRPEFKEYYRKRNEDPRIKERSTDTYLRRKYGIGLNDKKIMYASQRGLCEICAEPMSTLTDANVDHHHGSGAVRALLCHHCNVSIGLLKEDVERIKKVIGYLEKHNGSNRPK
jgi:hypothetical protein